MSKSVYDARKALHRCVWCGRRDAYTINGRAYCAECCRRRSGYYKKRYVEKPETKEPLKRYQKERYRRLKDMGLCTRCGKRPAATGRVMCARCSSREKLRQAEIRLQKG